MMRAHFYFFKKYIKYLTAGAGIFIVIAGVAGMAGWIYSIPFLTNYGIGQVPIRPNAALSFIETGIGIILIGFDKNWSRIFIRILSLLIFVTGSLTAMEYMTGHDLHIDYFYIKSGPEDLLYRMSILSSLTFIITGTGLFIMTIKKPGIRIFSYLLLALIFTAGAFDLLFYLLGLNYSTDFKGFHTASFLSTFLLIVTALTLYAFVLSEINFRIIIEHKMMTGITMATALVILIGSHFIERFRYLTHLQDNAKEIITTRNKLNELMSNILDLQTGVRGYLLSSDKDFLGPAYKAKEKIQNQFNGRDTLLLKGDISESELHLLHNLVLESISYADKLIGTEKTSYLDSSGKMFATGYGKWVTDSIKDIVSRLIMREDKSLLMLGTAEKEMRSKSKALILLNIFVQIVLLIVILRIAVNGIARRNKSIEEIEKLNESLEEKVALRTFELANSQKLYKSLFENNPVPMYIFDMETLAFLEVNEAMIIQYGFSRNELQGMTIYDIRPNDGIEILNKNLSEMNKSYHKADMVRHIKKNGSIIYVEASSLPIDYKGRNARLALANDITVRIIAEDEIKAVNDSLEKRVAERTRQLEFANRVKSEFLTNMSHEIRTPMNAILGYTELLASLARDPVQFNYIDSIKTSGRALMSLINDILDLSKIEADQLELDYEFVNSETFFHEFRRIYAARSSEKKLNFIVDVSPDISGFIFIDETRLRQVIVNLVGNSVKFTDKGMIRINAYCENTYNLLEGDKEKLGFDLVIEVVDTGIGIPKESQLMIFDSFVQLKNRIDKGGTGLGLAITQRLVKLMKGTISVNSEPDRGSIFTVRIPEVSFRRFEKNKVLASKIRTTGVVFDKAVVLIADDVENNRNYLRDILMKTNLNVLEAVDGKEALEIVENLVPDLVIADIKMPELNGFELLEKIKANEKLRHIPVVAYSASVMKEQRGLILKSNFAGLLVKPVSVHDLYEILMRFLPYRNSPVLIPDEVTPSVNEDIKNISELITSLEGSFKEGWLAFENRQPLGEVRKFGKSLIDLGNTHNSFIVRTYGKELVSAAESFNVEALLSLLKKFNDIVETVKSAPRL